jgi:hypothetical protein
MKKRCWNLIIIISIIILLILFIIIIKYIERKYQCYDCGGFRIDEKIAKQLQNLFTNTGINKS